LLWLAASSALVEAYMSATSLVSGAWFVFIKRCVFYLCLAAFSSCAYSHFIHSVINLYAYECANLPLSERVQSVTQVIATP
jgi:hypothetical protein